MQCNSIGISLHVRGKVAISGHLSASRRRGYEHGEGEHGHMQGDGYARIRTATDAEPDSPRTSEGYHSYPKGADMTAATSTAPTRYLTADQVCELIPGMTKPLLGSLRFKGTGPRYFKPTPKKVLYTEADVIAWVEASARTGTAEGK